MNDGGRDIDEERLDVSGKIFFYLERGVRVSLFS